jgi:hypothetical protein
MLNQFLMQVERNLRSIGTWEGIADPGLGIFFICILTCDVTCDLVPALAHQRMRCTQAGHLFYCVGVSTQSLNRRAKCRSKCKCQRSLEPGSAIPTQARIPRYLVPPIFFSCGVLRYSTQTWRNNTFRCLLRSLPRPQDVDHVCLRYCKFFNPFYNLNCRVRERATWRRVTEKSHFSTLNIGLARTGNQTQATRLAGSVTSRSAIQYASRAPNKQRFLARKNAVSRWFCPSCYQILIISSLGYDPV